MNTQRELKRVAKDIRGAHARMKCNLAMAVRIRWSNSAWSALRLVQVFTLDDDVESVREAVGGFVALNVWREQLSKGRSLVYLLLHAD